MLDSTTVSKTAPSKGAESCMIYREKVEHSAPMDNDIAPLCDALNELSGLEVLASSGGHETGWEVFVRVDRMYISSVAPSDPPTPEAWHNVCWLSDRFPFDVVFFDGNFIFRGEAGTADRAARAVRNSKNLIRPITEDLE